MRFEGPLARQASLSYRTPKVKRVLSPARWACTPSSLMAARATTLSWWSPRLTGPSSRAWRTARRACRKAGLTASAEYRACLAALRASCRAASRSGPADVARARRIRRRRRRRARRDRGRQHLGRGLTCLRGERRIGQQLVQARPAGPGTRSESRASSTAGTGVGLDRREVDPHPGLGRPHDQLRRHLLQALRAGARPYLGVACGAQHAAQPLQLAAQPRALVAAQPPGRRAQHACAAAGWPRASGCTASGSSRRTRGSDNISVATCARA